MFWLIWNICTNWTFLFSKTEIQTEIYCEPFVRITSSFHRCKFLRVDRFLFVLPKTSSFILGFQCIWTSFFRLFWTTFSLYLYLFFCVLLLRGLVLRFQCSCTSSFGVVVPCSVYFCSVFLSICTSSFFVLVFHFLCTNAPFIIVLVPCFQCSCTPLFYICVFCLYRF